ncbi:MAG: DNA-3-methyladenine glycosylase 2 family protein [Chloroflexi bacterium]|nr:DNA-3-methyladenine glycosylase 2 family protein [Chloroflexota bacterium]
MARRTLSLSRPLDLVRTLRPLYRGRGDPAMQLTSRSAIRATRTAAGPATILLELRGTMIEAEAWGPGADILLERLPAFLGEDDDDTAFDPGRHPVVAGLARRLPGVRIGRTGAVLEALLPAIFEQKVTGTEAARAFRSMIRAVGEPAPGPIASRFALRVLPPPAALAALPYHAFHPFGIEQRRAELVRRVCRDAVRLEALAELGGPRVEIGVTAAARLRSFPGIGPWTAAEVTLRALGDPDAVSVGDVHLPNLVAFALAGEPRGDDARMLELLEPWRGHRARVMRLLESSGIEAPKYGPRPAPRDIRAI